GVWFDTAHGRMNFSFDVGRRVIEQGVLPHCISTDLTVPGRVLTVHSLTEMMTRFLGLGFTLPQVVTMCTANPAKAIGAEQRLGRLAVGRQADISVLDIREGDWMVYDVLGTGLRVDRARCRSSPSRKGACSPRTGARARGAGSRTGRCRPAGPSGGAAADDDRAGVVESRALRDRGARAAADPGPRGALHRHPEHRPGPARRPAPGA